MSDCQKTGIARYKTCRHTNNYFTTNIAHRPNGAFENF